jgi:stage V sporulation protein S
MTLIKVAASSDVAAVAGAIAGMARENQRTEIQVVGAAAIHQAVKVIVFANEYLRENRILVAFVPEYVNVAIQDRKGIGIKFLLQIRSIKEI